MRRIHLFMAASFGAMLLLAVTVPVLAQVSIEEAERRMEQRRAEREQAAAASEQRLAELEAENAALKEELESLRAELAELGVRVPAGEGAADPSDAPGHTMDLTEVAIPDAPLHGEVGGKAFTLHTRRARFTSLEFWGERAGDDIQGITVSTGLPDGTPLAGQSWEILTPNEGPAQFRDPQISMFLRLLTEGEQFRNNYVLRLYLEEGEDENTLTGRIYLCLPDEHRSWIAGTFTVPIDRRR